MGAFDGRSRDALPHEVIWDELFYNESFIT